jgi:hypothetical protein
MRWGVGHRRIGHQVGPDGAEILLQDVPMQL